MKKAIIYTLSKSYNFGAFLQSFALQEYLKSIGLDVYFYSSKEINYGKFKYIKNKNPQKVFYNIKQAKKFESDQKNLNYTNRSDICYDYAFVGSDELWNVNNKSFKHIDEYFGYNINANRIIAYAPSCNNLSMKELKKFNNKYDFNKFNYLSARDINTKKLLNGFNKNNIEIVLDPTFLYSNYNEHEIVPQITDKYIAIYGYEFTNQQIQSIKEYAKQNNLITVSLGLYNKWCDLNIKMNSFEFLGYINKAEFVFTSTFHGTIFSVIYNKDFITFSNNKDKILYLLKQLDIENIDFTYKDIGGWNKNIIDYKLVNDKLGELRKRSIEYIKGAIND